MDGEVDQVVQAIAIASDPSQYSLHQQALEYLQNIERNATQTWGLALAIFVDANPDGTRKHHPQARFWALRVLEDFLEGRYEPLDDVSFRTLQQALVNYIQSEYVYGSAESSATFLRNKFSHTLTLFFLCTYVDQWPSFFTDIFTLLQPTDSSKPGAPYNSHVSLLFFHIVLEISGEVADQIIKSARAFSEERHRRDGLVRDAVRERDAPRINDAVVAIIEGDAQRMVNLRASTLDAEGRKELDAVTEVVDWGVRTFGSYVGWVDINLTVTERTVTLLFTLLRDTSLPIRLATSVALLRILSKGLKEPADKLQLIRVLSLGQVIDALESKTRAEQAARGEDTDEGEESYREALGRLLNVLGAELIKLIEESPQEDIRGEATRLLGQILPVTLRFMSDEYDDTSSTVFPLIRSVLVNYKQARKTSTEPIDDAKRSFLTSLLQVILEKMKWEEKDDPEDMDEEDKAAFEDLRKDLRTFMDSIHTIDQGLVTNASQSLAINTFTAHQNGVPLKWHDVELAIHVVFIFGEINKTGGKGRAAFCQAPSVSREQRKETDYSSYPLTNHGEMLFAMVQSGVSTYPHASVTMQYFETVARYADFFKVRKECIVPTLGTMIGAGGLHSSESAIKSRVCYLFSRFTRESKNDISLDVALTLIDGIRDLLVPKVELPEPETNEEQPDLLTAALDNPGFFDAQLYLFETAGMLVSMFAKSPEQQAGLLHSLVKPLLEQLQAALQTPIKGPQDVVPVLTVHHVIMALGNVAKGFPDFPSPVPAGFIMPPLEVFQEVSNAILISLEAMNVFKVVRDATRFAFARIIATMGPSIAQVIPPLMGNLLAHFEPTELVDFMNFIGLLIHKLQRDLFDVLDQLVGPLNAHIADLMSQPVTGTDDALMHVETKRAYIGLLNAIMAAKLQDVFLSSRNNDRFEPLLTSMEQLAEDLSDPASAKAAFVFLGRGVAVWGQEPQQGLPGFERFIYDQLVPSAFRVVSLPAFNIKDGQMLTLAHEIANFLQIVMKTRKQEAYDFFVTAFLPSQGWPPEMATEFTTKLRDLDLKTFRKYFADMIRASRT